MPNVKVRLDADGSRFNTVMNSAMAKVGSFGKQMASTMGGMMLANFGTAAIKSAVDSTVKLAGTLGDLRKELGIVEQDLYALRKASGDAGGGIDEVSKAFRALGTARRQALSGDAKKIGLFGQLGISQDELKNLKGIQLGERVSQGLNRFGASGKSQLMTQLAGRGVAKSFGPMQEALQDFGGYKTGLTKNGMLPKQESFEKLDKLDATLDDLKTTIEVGLIGILGTLIESIAKWANIVYNKAERTVDRNQARFESVHSDSYKKAISEGKSGKEANEIATKVAQGYLMAMMNDTAFFGGNMVNRRAFGLFAGVDANKAERAAEAVTPITIDKQAQRAKLLQDTLTRRKAEREAALRGGDDFDGLPTTKEASLKDFKAKQRELAAGQGGVAVGNFLGSSVNILQQLATETNDYLSQIRDYTKQMAEKQAATSTIPDEGDIVE